MLALTRKVGQWLTIKHAGETARITIKKVSRRGTVVLIDAPQSFGITRDDAVVTTAAPERLSNHVGRTCFVCRSNRWELATVESHNGDDVRTFRVKLSNGEMVNGSDVDQFKFVTCESVVDVAS